MPGPAFLTLAEVLKIHRDQVERYGGTVGIRDLALLQSALAMPAATFSGKFLHADLPEMASAYLFHIIRDHLFIDGNKRTGTVAALIFLIINGYKFQAPENDLVKTVMAVAAGKMGKAELTIFFRKWMKKRSGK